MSYNVLKKTIERNQPDVFCWLLMNWFLCLFVPGAGEPEEAGRDNPSAHGGVREHHRKTAGTFKAPRNPTNPTFLSGVIYSRVYKLEFTAHVSTWCVSQRGNTQALRRKQRFQTEVENDSSSSSLCLRAGDTTFLSRVSLTHIVVTVSINKGPSQHSESGLLPLLKRFPLPRLWNRDTTSLSRLISFLAAQIWSILLTTKTAEGVWEL